MVDWPVLVAKIRSALRRRGGAEHDLDDLVQEAWIRLACGEREQTVDNPEAFMMRAALNLSIDEHRARKRRGEEVLVEDAVLVDAAPSAETVAEGRQRLERLGVCVGRLNDKTRAIFVAHRIHGMSYQEIARLHGLSISSVEKHIARATLEITTGMEGW